MFLVGEFARIGGVTAKALRHYDSMGLFSPAFTDPSNGYRWYTPAQLPALRRIVALRDLGVPLREVADLIAGGADLRDVLARRRRELQEHQEAVEQKLAELDIRVELADDGPDVVLRTVEPERIASITERLAPGEDLGRLFYEVEEVVRDARARAARPPGVLVTEGAGPRDVEVFVPVTADVSDRRVTSRVLPGGRVAAAIHQGPYGELRSVLAGLTRWVGAAGLSRSGPMRIIYLRFGAEPELEVPQAYLASRAEEFVTELQIPVG
ncbi:MAG TPA: MerR family transcriptional regulator [Acidimicrobiia bacterium]|nr:MerR family transcriptional regulator [Acidimicrobiia bacterium]